MSNLEEISGVPVRFVLSELSVIYIYVCVCERQTHTESKRFAFQYYVPVSCFVASPGRFKEHKASAA